MLFFGYISNILVCAFCAGQLTLCCEHLVDESRDDMRVFKIVVIMGAIHIGWYNTCKLTAMLLMVGPVDDHRKYIHIYVYIMMLSFYRVKRLLDKCIHVLYVSGIYYYIHVGICK